MWREFLRDESGSELAEYALALSLFAMATLVALGAISVAASLKQDGLQTKLTTYGASPP